MNNEVDSILYQRELVEHDHPYPKILMRHDQKDKSRTLFLKPTARPSEIQKEINPYEWLDVDGYEENSSHNRLDKLDDPIVESVDLALHFLFPSSDRSICEEASYHTPMQTDDDNVDVCESDEVEVPVEEPWRVAMDAKLATRRLRVDGALLTRILGYLENDKLAQMSTAKENLNCEKMDSTIRQIQVESLAKKLRIAFATTQWRTNDCALVHACMLEHLPISLLMNYIYGFRALLVQRKVSNLLEEINLSCKNLNYVERFAFDQFIKLINSETLDPPKKKLTVNLTLSPGLPRPVAVCLTFPVNPRSRRLVRFLQTLGNFCRVITQKTEDDSIPTLRARLNNLKRKILMEMKAGNPVFVVGWGVGSLLAMISCLQVSRHEIQSGIAASGSDPLSESRLLGVICLGLATRGLKGPRGEVDDPLLGLKTPSLLVTGSNSLISPPHDVELLRERMRGSARQVTLGGCDHLLRMTSRWRRIYRCTQEDIDAKIGKEILDFMSDRLREVQSPQDRADTELSDSLNLPTSLNSSNPIVCRPPASLGESFPTGSKYHRGPPYHPQKKLPQTTRGGQSAAGYGSGNWSNRGNRFQGDHRPPASGGSIRPWTEAGKGGGPGGGESTFYPSFGGWSTGARGAVYPGQQWPPLNQRQKARGGNSSQRPSRDNPSVRGRGLSGNDSVTMGAPRYSPGGWNKKGRAGGGGSQYPGMSIGGRMRYSNLANSAQKYARLGISSGSHGPGAPTARSYPPPSRGSAISGHYSSPPRQRYPPPPFSRTSSASGAAVAPTSVDQEPGSRSELEQAISSII